MANTLRFKRGLVSGIPTAALGEPLFTTDTFDLYIGNGTGNTRFQKYIASGTTSQLLRGDGSLLTMPIVLTSPSNGQVLKFNGTNWVNDSDAGITGSGTTNYLPKFTGGSTLGNSLLQEGSNAIGLSATPSAWGSSWKALEFSNGVYLTSFSASAAPIMILGANAHFDNTNFIYKVSSVAASRYQQDSGTHYWYTAPSGTAGNAITFTQSMTLNANGRLLLGSVSDNGLRFQVTGDGYFSGSVGIGTSSLSAVSLRVAKNITGAVGVNGIVNDGQIQTDVTNSVNYFYTIANTAASLTMTNLRHYLAVQGTFGAGTAITNQIGFYANSSMISATNNYGFYGDLASGTGRWNLYLVGTAANHINGNLQLGSATAFASAEKFQLTGDARIKTIGTGGLILEATSGTETPNLTFLSTTNRYNLDNSSGTLRFFRENTDGTSGAVRMSLTDDGNLGIGMTPSYKLDVTGEARVSNAIAIGTTPDTNKPFKILKNINGTVGINFENTSTGSLAFSAIQMGTDVTGGTKFTNLVYASSGVTASGVYNPDGTSLINNGSGGLNFLGNPIRMYTGGSNGTLRWDMTNDGFITQYTGTNPSTSATDGYRQYSADVVAGNAAPHFRTENGAVIKLYQETTGVGNAIFSQGGGNSVLDDSTFDGYTLRQIVKALRNQGILA